MAFATFDYLFRAINCVSLAFLFNPKTGTHGITPNEQ